MFFSENFFYRHVILHCGEDTAAPLPPLADARSIAFDGTAGVNLGDSDNWEGINGFTLIFQSRNNTLGDQRGWIGKDDGNTVRGWSFCPSNDSGFNPEVLLIDPGAGNLKANYASGSIAIDTWYSWVVCWGGGDETDIDVYKDGSLLTAASRSDTGFVALDNNSADLRLGNVFYNWAPYNNAWLNGYLRQVAFLNSYKMDSTEVTELSGLSDYREHSAYGSFNTYIPVTEDDTDTTFYDYVNEVSWTGTNTTLDTEVA